MEAPELAPDIKPSGLRGLSHQEQAMTFQRLSPLLRHFSRYLTVGGFPELALSKDEFYAQRVMRDDVVDKVLKRDIPAIYNIRSIADLEKIFLYLCYNSSSIISMEAISRELCGVSRPTVEKYIQYLASALLVTKREDDFGPLIANPAVYRIPAYAFMYLLGHAEKNGYVNYI